MTQAYITHLIETDEGSYSNIVLAQGADTFLSCFYGIHHYVVQSPAGGRDGYIVLVIDCPKITL